MTRSSCWLLLALLVSILPSVLTSSPSSSASLFLHPCNGAVTKPAKVSPPQANRLLAYHLDVPGEFLGLGADDRDAWSSIVRAEKQGKEGVKAFFEDTRQRTIVLLNGVDEAELRDIVPLSFQNTHTIESSPSPASFEALVHSYGERIHEAIPLLGSTFGGFFMAAVEEVQNVLEDATEMLVGGSAMSVPVANEGWKKSLDAMDLTGKASTTFRQSMANLVSYFDSFGNQNGNEAQPSFHALRFDGLSEIKETYGQESTEYKEAKKALKSVLSAAAMKLDKLASSFTTTSQALAIIAVADDNEVTGLKVQPRADLLTPFRTRSGRSQYQKRRDASIWDSLESANKNKDKNGGNGKAPKESDYVGKCFTKEDDLNKATNDCSGHGKPKKSMQGGKACYRCQCQTTRKSGKTTEWAGAACQKQDISKPFVLLASSTVVLVLVSIGSVLYLFNEGQKELPSVLAGISIPNK